MSLQGLIYRELGEGMTEEELASAVRVPRRTVVNILAGEDPKDPAVWEQLAKYFRMDVDFLRSGELAHAKTLVELQSSPVHSAAGQIRKIPLLNWQEMEQMATGKTLPCVIQAEAVIETTEVSGARTFALKVQDDSMEPLFGRGEMIFVNPDLEWGSGDYVIAHEKDGLQETILLRQVKSIGCQWMLHPLNRKYEDHPLTIREEVWGKVVRLRKNF